MFNKKTMLLVGLAAAYFAYRYYSKLSPEEKESLKEKGKKLLEEHLPENFKNIFATE